MDNPLDVLQQKLEQCGMSKPFLNILWLRKKSRQLHKDDQKLLHDHVHRKIGKKNTLLMFPIKTNLDIQESDMKLTETVLLLFQTLTTVMVKRNYSPRQLYVFFWTVMVRCLHNTHCEHEWFLPTVLFQGGMTIQHKSLMTLKWVEVILDYF